jgi:hypothetical protein
MRIVLLLDLAPIVPSLAHDLHVAEPRRQFKRRQDPRSRVALKEPGKLVPLTPSVPPGLYELAMLVRSAKDAVQAMNLNLSMANLDRGDGKYYRGLGITATYLGIPGLKTLRREAGVCSWG